LTRDWRPPLERGGGEQEAAVVVGIDQE